MSPAEFQVIASEFFEEEVFGLILVSSILSQKIVPQSAFQYLSPGPKQKTKTTEFGKNHFSSFCGNLFD